MRILITTDGSDFSRAAVEKCCRMFIKPGETAVRIVSVYEIILPLDILPASAEFTESIEQSAHRQAEDFAEQAAAMIRESFPDSDLDLSIQVSSGAPDQILSETAQEWQADIVVVGSHGRGFWGRMLVGSVTDALIHHAPCSVLVVRTPPEQMRKTVHKFRKNPNFLVFFSDFYQQTIRLFVKIHLYPRPNCLIFAFNDKCE